MCVPGGGQCGWGPVWVGAGVGMVEATMGGSSAGGDQCGGRDDVNSILVSPRRYNNNYKYFRNRQMANMNSVCNFSNFSIL